MSYQKAYLSLELPRLEVWSGVDWVESFRVVPLSSGLESVCDKSLCESCDPEACKEFCEPNLPLPTGTDGTANPRWEWSPVLK